jgi:hypothetical protein
MRSSGRQPGGWSPARLCLRIRYSYLKHLPVRLLALFTLPEHPQTQNPLLHHSLALHSNQARTAQPRPSKRRSQRLSKHLTQLLVIQHHDNLRNNLLLVLEQPLIVSGKHLAKTPKRIVADRNVGVLNTNHTVLDTLRGGLLINYVLLNIAQQTKN